MPEPGQPAPLFKLRSTDRSLVSLGDFLGKQNVIILFVPAAFSGVCTRQFCLMRDSLAEFNKLKAAVIGISVDSLFALSAWKEQQAYNFTLLSDFNKTTAKKYDAYYKDFVFGMKGVAKRAAFVVDRQGTIRYAEVLEDAGMLPNFDSIKKILEELN
jgi:peroxiredoxin